jgi:hypothetical protein
VSYKEIYVAVLEGELGQPLFKVDGLGVSTTEFVHSLRNELASAVVKWPRLAWVSEDPYFLMKYCLEWIVNIDHLKLFDWRIVYTTPEGGFLQLSYCRPGFIERGDETETLYATRFERILQDETLV